MRPPGFEPGSSAWQAGGEIDWSVLREGFIDYLASRGLNERYRRGLIRYLDKYVTVIRGPGDVVRLFAGVRRARHHLALGLRNLFNYLEIEGFSAYRLSLLRRALPKIRQSIDVRVPSEGEILDSLRRLRGIPEKYSALFNLLLDSGVRLVEGVRLIKGFEETEDLGGFYRVDLGYCRGSKRAFYAYFTEETCEELRRVAGIEDLTARNASHYYQKYRFTAPKYLRKYAFDKMIELEIPESVADFIEGRSPRRIGAKHYLALRRQADRFYRRYAEHLERLREEAEDLQA